MLLGSIRLTVSLIRIPRLFASLFLLPIILSLALVYLQLVVTGVVLKSLRPNAERVDEHYQQAKSFNLGRRIIYGNSSRLPPLKICRWIPKQSKDGKIGEVPPGAECAPDRLDVAITAPQPETFDVAEYQRIFEGNIERLHICRACRPDLIVSNAPHAPRIDAHSIQALIVLSLAAFNDDVHAQYVAAVQGYDQIRRLLGEVYFHARDLRRAVNLNVLEASLAMIFNIAVLIVISLWLALKAHRKVLDYFIRNGALLPMVAATGKTSFYSAIWLLTLLRVGAFLLAAVPLTYYGFKDIVRTEELQSFFGDDILEFVLWVIAIASSLSLATLVASIADLRHRRHIVSIVYRYIPLLACCLGAFFWAATFIFDHQFFSFLRSVATAMPILGIGPVLLAPVFKPQLEVLVIHTLLTVAIAVLMLKLNARWFAAHLEEL